MKSSKRLGWFGAGLLAVALLAGCSLYRNDRAYLPDSQFQLARQLYLQTGSLDLVQRQLQDMEWTRGHVNEAIYRLQKEFEVLPEELPATAQNTETTSGTTAITLPATATINLK